MTTTTTAPTMLAGFLRTDRSPPPRHRILKDLGTLFLTPALAEEAVFRALMLPHPSEAPSLLALGVSGGVALTIFVLYHHPLQTAIAPRILPVFSHRAFLSMAGVLGAACSGTYYATGSLWPPVLIHWAAVSVWYFKLGGYEKLRDAGYAK